MATVEREQEALRILAFQSLHLEETRLSSFDSSKFSVPINRINESNLQ